MEGRIEVVIVYTEEVLLGRCRECIDALTIPEVYQIRIREIRGGDRLMETLISNPASKEEPQADYYIYLMQNAYPIYEGMLEGLLREWKDPKVGAVGVLGGHITSDPGVGAWDEGSVYLCNEHRETIVRGPGSDPEGVGYLHGMLIMTRQPIPADEILRAGVDRTWDLQWSSRLREQGLRLAVPAQESPWVMYEYGASPYDRYDFFSDDIGCRFFIAEHPEEPLVSVLCAVYNAGEQLRETLDGIVNQTYRNLQIVIVDDCSTDQSRDILREYATRDSRIELIFHEKNTNVCIAGNDAYAQARGKYIAVIGHDDIWYPSKLSEQIGMMEHYPEYGYSFTWLDVIDRHSQIRDVPLGHSFQKDNRSRKEWAKLLFTEGNYLAAPSAVVRREFLKDQLYEIRYLQVQDYSLWMKLLYVTKPYVLKENLLQYRYEENNASHISAMTSQDRMIRVARETAACKTSFLMGLSDELFREFFGEGFRLPSAFESEELLCERAFLLCRLKIYEGLQLLGSLIEQEEFRMLLEKKYSFTVLDYYKMNGEK